MVGSFFYDRNVCCKSLSAEKIFLPVYVHGTVNLLYLRTDGALLSTPANKVCFLHSLLFLHGKLRCAARFPEVLLIEPGCALG